MKLHLTLNGKKITNLKKELNDVLNNALVEAVKEKIEPFNKEIEKQNGEVFIDLTADRKVSVRIENISDDLKDRITFALS